MITITIEVDYVGRGITIKEQYDLGVLFSTDIEKTESGLRRAANQAIARVLAAINA